MARSINDPNNAVSTGPPTNFTTEISLMVYFLPIGDGVSASSFWLMKRSIDCYVFGNDNGSMYTRQLNKFSVTGPVGTNNGLPRNPTPSTTGGNGSNILLTYSSQGSSTSVGAIVGIIVGLVALAGLAFFIIKKRRTIQNKDTATAAAATAASLKTELPFDQSDNNAFPQHPGQNGKPNYDTTGKYPATGYSVGLNEPTTIPPMAPYLLYHSNRPTRNQDQMNDLPFSSRPRPNFVTGSHDGQHSDIPASAPGSPTAPWRPTPFVPPAQFDSITEIPPSSVGYYSPAAITFSSATAQSSYGPQTFADDYEVSNATAQSSHGPQIFVDADEVPMV
ncbi:hypothetical protein BGW39_001464, partial [Mortierella sp. 14UC]